MRCHNILNIYMLDDVQSRYEVGVTKRNEAQPYPKVMKYKQVISVIQSFV